MHTLLLLLLLLLLPEEDSFSMMPLVAVASLISASFGWK